MKNTAVIRLAVLAALSLLALAACDLLNSVSTSERLNLFVAELNKADRSKLYLNLDPAAAKYSAAKVGSFWDTLFPTDGTYTATVSSSTGSTIVATLKNTGSFASTTVTFTFSPTGMLGNVYVISAVKLGTVTVFD